VDDPVMPPHVILERDGLDLLFGWGSIALALVAVVIAVWAQWSVRSERRRVSEVENAWRVFETFKAWQGSSDAQKSVLRGLLATLRAEDFPMLRVWLDTNVTHDNRATEDAVAEEYGAAVARRL
jgi:hypothetical protein